MSDVVILACSPELQAQGEAAIRARWPEAVVFHCHFLPTGVGAKAFYRDVDATIDSVLFPVPGRRLKALVVSWSEQARKQWAKWSDYSWAPVYSLVAMLACPDYPERCGDCPCWECPG